MNKRATLYQQIEALFLITSFHLAFINSVSNIVSTQKYIRTHYNGYVLNNHGGPVPARGG